MIPIKTKKQIQIMQEGGAKLAKIRDSLIGKIKPGVNALEVEKLAQKMILKAGGKPSFQMVKGYKWATCICIDDCVVHGVPTDYKFQGDDVVGLDIGMYYKGMHTDTSKTLRVKEMSNVKCQMSNVNVEIDKFLKTGEQALEKAIQQVKPGNRIGDISKAIQDTVEKAGYSVVHELVGHGVGKELHEEPEIPGFLSRKINKTPILKEGMVLAIEVIYNIGLEEIFIDESDGWTIRTKDGKISGLFEKTVAVIHGDFLVLT